MSLPQGREDLCPAFCTGDREAYARIFLQFYKPLCRFANRYIQQKQEAEDLVAEVFIKLWEKGGCFLTLGHLNNWLYRCTLNASLNSLKYGRLPHEKLVVAHGEIPQESADHFYSQGDKAKAAKLLSSLSPKCRYVFIQKYLYGRSLVEIAGRMQVSPHTVKNHLARGHQCLQKTRRKNPGFY